MKSLIRIIFLTVTIMVSALYIAPRFVSNADTLDAIYFYLSRMQTNINGSSATVEYLIALSPSQNIPTSGTVTITFPDADDTNWCRTAGALTVAGVSSSIVDLAATNWDIDAVLPNNGSALTATCTQGAGANSSDVITISNVGALSTGTTYGFQLSNGSSAGVIGTDDTPGSHPTTVTTQSGATIDSSTFDLELVSNDTVTVSATVTAAPTVNCSISTNTVNLGTLFPGGAYSTATHTISTSTSLTTNGYYWAAYGTGNGSTDAGLYKSDPTTYLLASTGSTTIDLTGIAAEGFGMTVSDPDGAGAAVVPSDFSDASPGTFGALDRTSAGARLILYQNGAQASADNSTITYGAKASGSAEAGSYSENVHFTCGAYY
ncbi:MAG TPA: hypothetical protein PLV59_00580 [Candidatus Dojkabacteria bacterium]|nr:hypothetical protein [Candidatus Dojkabacteria bacterium]